MDAEPDLTPFKLILNDSNILIKEGDYNMVEDLEGMSIYYKDNGDGYIYIKSGKFYIWCF